MVHFSNGTVSQRYSTMAYRRTSNVARQLASRQAAILAAAQTLAAEGGMRELQIAPVAARAGIAAGTVYRYFPAKADLVAALVLTLTEHELGALRRAADAAPGSLSALTVAIATFAARALSRRRLAVALLVESAEREVDSARLPFRAAMTRELETRIRTALAAGRLPDQDAAVAARALMGMLIEGLIGPLTSTSAGDPASRRVMVQTLTLIALRALGITDARARGLVVQAPLPSAEDAADRP
jgi:AcrR family transcriptional regulator